MEIVMGFLLFLIAYLIIGAICLLCIEFFTDDHTNGLTSTDMGIMLLLWPACMIVVVVTFLTSFFKFVKHVAQYVFTKIVDIVMYLLTNLGNSYIRIRRKVLKRKQ